MMLQRLRLTQTDWEKMRSHLDSCAPMEGCGLLAGLGNTVHQVFLIANQEQSPSRFRMVASEQLRAFQSMEERSMELLGIFHSHPADERAGPVGPSPTDVEEAAYPVVHVIW